MNQIKLDVKLYSTKDTNDDILAFMFDNAKSIIHLNTDSCQIELKEVFSKLLTLSLENDVILNLIIEDGYNRGLYKDVCTEYISELQRELDNVKDSIRKELTEE